MSTTSKAAKSTLLGISWPIFVEQALRLLIGIVDTLLVSHVSDGAVAALGVANQIVLFFVISFNFIGIGSSVVITHYLGGGEPTKAGVIARTGIAVNTWLGLFAGILVFATAPQLLSRMNLPAELMHYAVPFLALMGGTLFLEAFAMSVAGVLRAHKYTRDAMYVGLGQNVINLVGSSVLLFGLFGAPKLGVVGVAVASVFSRCCACAVLGFVLFYRTRIRLRLADLIRVQLPKVREVLRIGLPAAAENICYWTAFMFVTSMVAELGGHSLAVQQYTMQLQRLVIIFTISIGLGTEILVGFHVGSGRLEDAFRQPLLSLRQGILLATALATTVASAAPYMLGLFTTDRQIIEACSWLLWLSIPLEAGRVFNIVVINSLRATGDVSFPIKMAVVSMWCVWVPLAWLAVQLDWGLPGIWLAMCTDEWFRGLSMFRRWRNRTWLPFALRSRSNVVGLDKAA